MSKYLLERQDNITVEYTLDDKPFVQETLDDSLSAFRFVAKYFGMELFPARIILVPDRREFDRCVKEVLNVDIEVPSHPRRIGQPQKTDLIVLSPRAWERGINEYTPDSYKKFLFHEIVHIVEEHLSPEIEKVTRWWSEGLAIYLSGQWRSGREIDRIAEGIRKKTIPAIKDMEDDSSGAVELSYTWGWTIVKYIDNTYGKYMIQKIVKECDDGDIFRMVGESLQEFEKRWKE